MNKLLIKFFCWLHNFSYKAIGSLAVREGNGIHPKHKILNYHHFFLDNISKNDSILDIGCGNGAVAYDIAQKAKHVTAIDIDEQNIKTAEKKFSRENLKYIVGDATSCDFQNKFDVIILSNVLEHIDKRIKFLSKIKKLSPKIIIRVPLITRDWLSVYKKENGLEYKLDSTHYVEYTEENFKKEIEKSGLEIENYYVKFGELYAIIK
ncbi:MAG: class I SAM-dependent methyltransferase [Candidatus Pacebacteria bacterium]|nr:class I SAM-dependent methyltransferase [Candidatus Paceibacterota bacterium]